MNKAGVDSPDFTSRREPPSITEPDEVFLSGIIFIVEGVIIHLSILMLIVSTDPIEFAEAEDRSLLACDESWRLDDFDTGDPPALEDDLTLGADDCT